MFEGFVEHVKYECNKTSSLGHQVLEGIDEPPTFTCNEFEANEANMVDVSEQKEDLDPYAIDNVDGEEASKMQIDQNSEIN